MLVRDTFENKMQKEFGISQLIVWSLEEKNLE
jgi:hypothetical protein